LIALKIEAKLIISLFFFILLVFEHRFTIFKQTINTAAFKPLTCHVKQNIDRWRDFHISPKKEFQKPRQRK
jgi:hypothetical protein